GLITSDNDFFDNQTPEDTKQFFEYAKEFLEQEYGKDNLLYATVHMDEKTPHMHYGVVPITDDGRLSAKEVVGNKKALTAFQDRFNEHVKQRGYDLESGQPRQVTNAKHEQISQYKQKTEYNKQIGKQMKEKTQQMNNGVIQITDDGCLSAKEVVGNKKALTAFQDRFNEHVKQRGYDLERGQPRQVTNAKHEQISQYKQKTEYHKQEYERESQKTDHIKQKNDKLMQKYQKSLNTLKKPINVPYEQETEKVGGLFSKEIQETGNVVISQKDFNEFQKQIKAAQDISEDYEYIKSGRALDDKDK